MTPASVFVFVWHGSVRTECNTLPLSGGKNAVCSDQRADASWQPSMGHAIEL